MTFLFFQNHVWNCYPHPQRAPVGSRRSRPAGVRRHHLGAGSLQRRRTGRCGGPTKGTARASKSVPLEGHHRQVPGYLRAVGEGRTVLPPASMPGLPGTCTWLASLTVFCWVQREQLPPQRPHPLVSTRGMLRWCPHPKPLVTLVESLDEASAMFHPDPSVQKHFVWYLGTNPSLSQRLPELPNEGHFFRRLSVRVKMRSWDFRISNRLKSDSNFHKTPYYHVCSYCRCCCCWKLLILIFLFL